MGMDVILNDKEIEALLAGRLPKACAVAWQRPAPWPIAATMSNGLLVVRHLASKTSMEVDFLEHFEMALMALLCFRAAIGKTSEFCVASCARPAILMGKAILDMGLCDRLLTPHADVADKLDDDRVRVSTSGAACLFSDSAPSGVFEFLATTEPISIAGARTLTLGAGIEPDFAEISMARGTIPIVVAMGRGLYDPRMAAMLVMDAMETSDGLRKMRK
jgi:hypothetical protein